MPSGSSAFLRCVPDAGSATNSRLQIAESGGVVSPTQQFADRDSSVRSECDPLGADGPGLAGSTASDRRDIEDEMSRCAIVVSE